MNYGMLANCYEQLNWL